MNREYSHDDSPFVDPNSIRFLETDPRHPWLAMDGRMRYAGINVAEHEGCDRGNRTVVVDVHVPNAELGAAR